MKRIALFCFTAMLINGAGFLLAETQSNSASTVSITVKNQGEKDLFLSLRHDLVPSPATPPRQAPPPTHGAQLLEAPSAPLLSHVQAQHIKMTVKANTSIMLELVPGEYYVSANSAFSRGSPPGAVHGASNAPPPIRIEMPATGYLSFTNTETWVFDMSQTNSANSKVLPSGTTWWKWGMTIPSRPGFHLNFSRMLQPVWQRRAIPGDHSSPPSFGQSGFLPERNNSTVDPSTSLNL